MHLSFSPEPAFLTVTPNLSIFCNLKSKDFSNQVLVSFCVRVLLSISLFTLVFQHEEKQAACSVHVCACVVASVLTLWPCELACQTLSMGILQAGILEWVSKPSSRGSSRPRDWIWSLMFPMLAGRFTTISTCTFSTFPCKP